MVPTWSTVPSYCRYAAQTARESSLVMAIQHIPGTHLQGISVGGPSCSEALLLKFKHFPCIYVLYAQLVQVRVLYPGTKGAHHQEEQGSQDPGYVGNPITCTYIQYLRCG